MPPTYLKSPECCSAPVFLLHLKVISLLLVSTYVIAGKKCDCEQEVKGLISKIELNSASYAKNVLEAGKEKEYQGHRNYILELAGERNSIRECIGLVTIYLSFFEDAHQKIYGSPTFYDFGSLSDSKGIRKFLNRYSEQYPVGASPKTDPLTGNWYHATHGYQVSVFPESSKGREYLGILGNNNPQNTLPGDTKIEFIKDSKGSTKCLFWDEWFQSDYLEFRISNDSLFIGRDHIFTRTKPEVQKVNNLGSLEPTTFREIDQNTNYLAIRSFEFRYKELIDSLIKHNYNKLTSKNILIIDLRNNRGGSDLCFESLMPLLFDESEYTEPLAGSIWVSEENFRGYSEERYEYLEDSLEADKEIERLKKYRGRFEPINFKKREIEISKGSPEKVFLLVDKKCASTTETFILTARQSQKVKVLGEPTKGAVSFGEWRPVQIEGLKSWVSMTQKKFEFNSGESYEMVGIKPDVSLEKYPKSSWLDLLVSMATN